MKSITFLVTGAPIPQPRPRFRSIPMGKGKARAQAYTPAKHKVTVWRKKVAACLARMNLTPTTEPVRVQLNFFIKRPKAHFGTGGNEGRLRDSAPEFPVTKSTGDIDNLVKAVLDEMNGVVFEDDAQVLHLIATKRYHNGSTTGMMHAKVESFE
jgi:Holliday junction resolvase RusA-like endonuclease